MQKIKYTAFIVSSIDGRISKDRRGVVDWASDEDWNFLQSSLAKMDAVIVGSNTYKVSKERLEKRNTIVLTSKVKKVRSVGSITFCNPQHVDIGSFITEKGYTKVAILGGPKVYDFFLESELLDELFVTIEPVIFTAGIPMVTGKKFKKHNFTLVAVKKLNKKGSLLLKYKKI